MNCPVCHKYQPLWSDNPEEIHVCVGCPYQYEDHFSPEDGLNQNWVIGVDSGAVRAYYEIDVYTREDGTAYSVIGWDGGMEWQQLIIHAPIYPPVSEERIRTWILFS